MAAVRTVNTINPLQSPNRVSTYNPQAGNVSPSLSSEPKHISVTSKNASWIKFVPEFPGYVFPQIMRQATQESFVFFIGRAAHASANHILADSTIENFKGEYETLLRSKKNTYIKFTSKVVSRNHAVLWRSQTDSKWYIQDNRSSSGTFINQERLSAPGTLSRPHALNSGDLLQFGIDYRGGSTNETKAVRCRIEICDTNPNVLTEFQKKSYGDFMNCGLLQKSNECSICLEQIQPGEALFFSACTHVYHYMCVKPLLHQYSADVFHCCVCRQYTNLDVLNS